MKTKLIILSILFIGLLGCEKYNTFNFQVLTNNRWILNQSNSTNINPKIIKESVTFHKDMSYEATTEYEVLHLCFENDTLKPCGIKLTKGIVIGEWELENERIIFLTAKVILDSTFQETSKDKPNRSFFSNTQIFNTPPSGLSSYEYEPIIWHIQEIKDTSLTVRHNYYTANYKNQ